MGSSAWKPVDESAPAASGWTPVDEPKPGLWDKIKSFGSGLSTAPILHPIDTAKSMLGMVAHPIDTLNAAEQGREDTVDRAVNEFHKGNYSHTAIHLALSLIPQIGPALSENYKEMRDAQDAGDDVAEAKAAGKMVGLAASVEAARNLPAAAKGIKTVAEATPHIVEAVADSGAAGDIAKGTAKAAGGAAVAGGAHALGLGPLGEYLASKDLIKSGVKDVGSGIKKSYDAFKEGVQNYQHSKAPPPEPVQRTPVWQSAQAMTPPAAPAAEAVAPVPAPSAPPTLTARLQARAAAAPPAPMAGTVAMPQPQPSNFSWPSEMQGPETPAPSPAMPAMDTQPVSDIPVTRADSIKPEVARTLTEGAKRVMLDGSTQTLTRIPLKQMAQDVSDEGRVNEIDKATVQAYVDNGYAVHPEVRPNTQADAAEKPWTITDGHHRLASDWERNGADSSSVVWKPDEATADPDDVAADKIKALVQKPDASSLKDTMRDLSPAMRTEAAHANYRAIQEGAPAADAGTAYKTAAQLNKAQKLAGALHDAKIPHADLVQMKPKDLQGQLSEAIKELKINKTGDISLDSVAQTLFELKKLESASAK